MILNVGYHSGLSLQNLTVSSLNESFSGLEFSDILKFLKLCFFNITGTTVIKTVINWVILRSFFILFFILMVFERVIVPTF